MKGDDTNEHVYTLTPEAIDVVPYCSDEANASVPYCSDGWHETKYGRGSYYVYKSHMVVNGVLSSYSKSAVFSLLVINAFFCFLAVNSAVSILSLVSIPHC